ncbi:MAG: DUF2059 domain-containing protein [Alphaproteobacteria bacterium]
MKSRYIYHVLIIAFFMLATPLPAGAVDAEKKAVIKELMDLSGANKVAIVMADMTSKSMLDIIKKQKPDIPDKALQAVDEELRTFFREKVEAGGLYELIYPIYDVKFSTEELTEIVKFYKTPLGRKVTKEMPEITRQATIKGQDWGQSLVPELQARVQKRLQAEGIK